MRICPKLDRYAIFFKERNGNLTRRTVQEEQARLRRQRRKAQGFCAIFKKPMHESLTSVLPIMLIVLALGFTIAPVPNNAMMRFCWAACCSSAAWAFSRWGRRCP